MTADPAARRARVAALNDRCREGRDPAGRIVVTRAALGLFAERHGPLVAQLRLLAAVRRHVFTEADSRDRDRGVLRLDGQEVRFRIDCYDRSLEWASPDPGDPAVTTRVLT